MSSSTGCCVTFTTAVLYPDAENEMVAVLISLLFSETVTTISQEPFPDVLSISSQSFSETTAFHWDAFVFSSSVCDDAALVKNRASGVTCSFFPCWTCSSLLQETSADRHRTNRTKNLVMFFMINSSFTSELLAWETYFFKGQTLH